ncbi:MAG: hypothetical protein H6806_12620 [Planctomycetes bacterium]|nr:hypothetical protein [Planctomycetota bacterium]
MSTDVRINVGVWHHPKWIRLRGRCGTEGLLALVRLWCWTGEYRDDGRLHGVADDEIEFVAAGWTGEPGKFLGALLDLRWAERDEAGVISLHDWRDHNPYRATRTARVRAARTAAIVKACKKRGEHLPEETERELSEAALVRFYGAKVGRHKYQLHQGLVRESAPRTCDGGASRTEVVCTPSPSPSPPPPPSPTGGGGEGRGGFAPSGSSAARPSGAAPPRRGGGPPRCTHCRGDAVAGPGLPTEHLPLGLDHDLCPGHLTAWLEARDRADRAAQTTRPLIPFQRPSGHGSPDFRATEPVDSS